MASSTWALGIDLGTHNTRASVLRGADIHVVPDAFGSAQLPSVVSFLPDARVLVGQEARERLVTAPRSTVALAKRLLGRQFFSDDVKRVRDRVPFEIAEGPDHSVRVVVNQHAWAVPEIEALILREIRLRAELMLQGPVDRAVITVPAHFNAMQRSSTEDAFRMAGLEALDIIEETAAAAHAYGLETPNAKWVMVFELSGDCCRVSVLDVTTAQSRVVGMAADPGFGGEDFDERILGWIVETLLQQGADIRQNAAAITRLRAAAEHAKNTLSDADQAWILVPFVRGELEGPALDVDVTLPRAQFDRMVMDLVQRSFRILDEALRTCSITARDIDEVVLVGGPARLPVIQNSLRRYFKKDPRTQVDPRLVVSVGAARHADAVLRGMPARMPPSPRAALTDAPLVEQGNADLLEHHAARRVQALMGMLSQAEALHQTQSARILEMNNLDQRVSSLANRMVEIEDIVATAVKQTQPGGPLHQLGAQLAESAARADLARRLSQSLDASMAESERITKEAQAALAAWREASVQAREVATWRQETAQVLLQLGEAQARQEALGPALGELGAVASRIDEARQGLAAAEAQLRQLPELREMVQDLAREMPAVRVLAEQVRTDLARADVVRAQALEQAQKAHDIADDTVTRVGAAAAEAAELRRTVADTAMALARHAHETEATRLLAARMQSEITDLHVRQDELRDRAGDLDKLHAQLDEVQDAARSGAQQLHELRQVHMDVQEKHALLRQWDRTRTEVETQRAALAEDRAGLEGLLVTVRGAAEQLHGFDGRVTELQGRLETVESAAHALAGVRSLQDDVAARMEELRGLGERLAPLEERLGEALGRHAELDKLHQALVGRKAELDALAARLDGASVQVQGLQGQLTNFAALKDRMAGVPEQVRVVKAELDEASLRLQSFQAATESLESREASLRALASLQDEMAQDLEERTRSVEKLVAQVDRGAEVRDALTQQAAAVGARLAELADADRALGERGREVDRLGRQLEERRGALLATAERLEARQTLFDELQAMATAAELQIEAAVARMGELNRVHEALAGAERQRRALEEATDATRERALQLREVEGQLTEARDHALQLRGHVDELRRQTASWEALKDDVLDATAEANEAATRLDEMAEQRALAELAVEKARELVELNERAEQLVKQLQKERKLSERIGTAVQKLRQKDRE